MRKLIVRLLQMLNAGDDDGQVRDRKLVKVSLSVGLAFTLWGLVTLNQSYEYNLYFPVKIIQVPDSLEVKVQETDMLNLGAEGLGVDLFMAYLRSRRDTLELPFRSEFVNDAPVPTDAYFNDIQATFTAPSIKINRVSPAQVLVDVDFKIFKKVPIELATDIGLKEAYQLENPPRKLVDSVKLYGAESRLNDIQVWYTRDPVTPPLDKPQTLTLAVDTAADIEVSPANIRVFVQPRLYTETVIELPIDVMDIPDQTEVRLSHPLLKVTCLVPMDEYEEVKEASRKQKFSIPYDELNPDFPYLIPDISFLENVKILYREPLEINYVIVHLQ